MGAPVRLRAGGALPPGVRLTLYRDGEAVSSTIDALETLVSEPGVYRVEAEVPEWDFPWIVSNPIYLLTPPERARRERAAILPDEVVVDAVNLLDPFNTGSTFVAVADGSTTLDAQFIDPEAGPDGSPAARIAFRLGAPSVEHPSPFASLGSYEPRNLARSNGLVFAVRSDDTYRFWVQVRDRNAAGPEGTETWSASVKTSDTWQNVTVPFDRLRAVEPFSDGILDLDEVEAIVFLVDFGAVPPETDGVIWIDDLGVY